MSSQGSIYTLVRSVHVQFCRKSLQNLSSVLEITHKMEQLKSLDYSALSVALLNLVLLSKWQKCGNSNVHFELSFLKLALVFLNLE